MGIAGSFTVTASGFPAPTLSESSATSLASLGLSFDPSTGVLSGTPAPNTGGTYDLGFTASNGIGSNATQDFSLDIDQPPTITSTDNTTFVDGVPGTFTVTATGVPTPTLSESGTLPIGVTFDASTGVLSGTPDTTDPGGVYTVSFSASNGVAPDATQSFFLVVNQPPAITSADNTTFVHGVLGTFTVTATGTPPPTLSESGTLPIGVTFDASTGVLGGTPDTTDPGGTYTVSFSASNGVGADATQSFVLVVDQPPAITSADNTTFVDEVPGTFTVTATGTPPPTLSESSATSLFSLGLSFDASTGVLSGTPGSNAGGTYALILTASNGIGSNATQDFSLTIDQPPAITSVAKTTFVNGVSGSFTVTATGVPTPTLSESGTLPSGVTFDASTGSLSGTPPANAVGLYSLAFTASNGVGTVATQDFVLSVVSPTIATTTTLSSSPNPSVSGQPVTFTATVTPASGTFDDGGTVTFEIDGDPSTAVTQALNNGTATYIDSALVAGDHSAQATFSGDTNFSGSSGSLSGIQVVNQLLTAPTNLVVTGVTTTSIAFSWTDNASGATDYEVQEAVAGSTNFAPMTGSPFGPGTTNATATGLTSGTVYQFEVRAVAATGPSAWLLSADIETLVSTATSLSADPNPLVLAQTSTNTVDQSNDVTFTATVTNTSGHE